MGRSETGAVAVVGGGILGVAVARELLRRQPGRDVRVLEKEPDLGRHQTGHNSGVVHAGIYYRPGSLKADLCTRGRLLIRDYCAEHALPYAECGKLVVAVEAGEVGRLEALERSARANGVPGLRRVGEGGIAEVEPHAEGLVALHSPQTAITDFVAVARTMAAEVTAAGGTVCRGTEVVGIRRVPGGIEVTTRTGAGAAGAGAGEVQRSVVEHVVVCAGLQSDRLANDPDLLGTAALVPRIVPFRGEYLQVTAAKQDLVRGMIYPVPDPRYPFLGVHFTRRVDGSLEVGPNAVLSLGREDYRWRDLDRTTMRDLRDTLTWPGTWRMAGEHWRTGVREVRGSACTAAFMRSAERYVPAVGVADVVRGRAGIRAQALDRDGTLVDDFRVDVADGLTAVRNAPSPAATSSMAIAEHVVDLVAR